MPAFLPSVNQIGFDSYDWIASTIARTRSHVLMWVIGASQGRARRRAGRPAQRLRVPARGRIRRALGDPLEPERAALVQLRVVPLRRFEMRGELAPGLRFRPGAVAVRRDRVRDGPELRRGADVHRDLQPERRARRERDVPLERRIAGAPPPARPPGCTSPRSGCAPRPGSTPGARRRAGGAAAAGAQARRVDSAHCRRPVLSPCRSTTTVGDRGSVRGRGHDHRRPRDDSGRDDAPARVRAYVIVDAYPVKTAVL